MILNINNLRKVSRNIHGNKAYNLSILMRNGINIPDGYLRMDLLILNLIKATRLFA